MDLKPYQTTKDDLPIEPDPEWDVTYLMDQNQKLLREFMDEILIQRAEAANLHNPETCKTISEESHQDMDELVDQLEETVAQLHLSEAKRTEMELDFRQKLQDLQSKTENPSKISFQE